MCNRTWYDVKKMEITLQCQPTEMTNVSIFTYRAANTLFYFKESESISI